MYHSSLNKFYILLVFSTLFWNETCTHFFSEHIIYIYPINANLIHFILALNLFYHNCMLWYPDRPISHFRCLKSRSFASPFRSFALSLFRCFVLSQFRIALTKFRIALSLFCSSIVSLFRSHALPFIGCFALLFRSLASPFRSFAWPFCCFAVSLFRSLVVLHRLFVVLHHPYFVS